MINDIEKYFRTKYGEGNDIVEDMLDVLVPLGIDTTIWAIREECPDCIIVRSDEWHSRCTVCIRYFDVDGFLTGGLIIDGREMDREYRNGTLREYIERITENNRGKIN